MVKLNLSSNVLTGASFGISAIAEPNSKNASTSEIEIDALIMMPSIMIGLISESASDKKPITVVNIAKNDGLALSRSVR